MEQEVGSCRDWPIGPFQGGERAFDEQRLGLTNGNCARSVIGVNPEASRPGNVAGRAVLLEPQQSWGFSHPPRVGPRLPCHRTVRVDAREGCAGFRLIAYADRIETAF